MPGCEGEVDTRSPLQPRVRPEGRTLEGAKFHGRLYAPHVEGEPGPPAKRPSSHRPPVPSRDPSACTGGWRVSAAWSPLLDQLCPGPGEGGWQQGQVVLAGAAPEARGAAQAVGVLQ